jgi:hypothetical protein
LGVELSEKLRGDLGVALNESRLLDVVLAPDNHEAILVMEVLTLPEVGPEPSDRRIALRCFPVGRIAASLRLGHWDDAHALVEAFDLTELSDVVRSFGGQPIYGWEFVDPAGDSWKRWSQHLSLDVELGDGHRDHVIEVFQASGAGPERHLDLRIWCDEFTVTRPNAEVIPLEEFAAGGVRWWDALYAGDERTKGHGIVPSAPAQDQNSKDM